MPFYTRATALVFCVLISCHVHAQTQTQWNNILFPKTLQNDPTYAINQVTGNQCCNQCLFLPLLQPCAHFPFGIDPQILSFGLSNCCSANFPEYMWFTAQGFDRVSMCLQQLTASSNYVPVIMYYFSTDQVNGNADVVQQDVSWAFISCQNPGYNVNNGYLPHDLAFVGTDGPCAPKGQIASVYKGVTAQTVTAPTTYIPFTESTNYPAPNTGSRQTSESWAVVEFNAGSPIGNVIRFQPDGNGNPTATQVGGPTGRCVNGSFCWDPIVPATLSSKITQWTYPGYNGWPPDPGASVSSNSGATYQVSPYPCGIYPMPNGDFYGNTAWTWCPPGNPPSAAPLIPNTTPYGSSVWCDAPTQYTPACANNNAQNYNYLITDNLIQTRGCSGWGICPIGNGQTCGGNGQCMHNARCFCSAGWGGLACDIPIPSRPYFCSQFNPCSGQGYCDDSSGQAQCICYTGWRGSPLNGTTLQTNGELNLYINAFLCATGASGESCLENSTALDYMQDHQCLFFVDTSANLDWTARYLRTTSSTIDVVISGNSGYTNMPLWYSGPSDPQLTTSSAPYDGLYTSGATVAVSQAVVTGFNCIDGRVVENVATLPAEDQTNPILRGGPSCLPCPPCVTAHSQCIQDPSDPNPYSASRVCQCFTNYGNSNPANPICDAVICPVSNGNQPCGGSDRGVCNPTGGTAPYLGFCQCRTGFSGSACQSYSCPVAPSSAAVGAGLICNGFTSSTPNVSPPQISNYSTPPATDCVSGTCVCNGPYWALNPSTGLCDLAGCAISPTSGLECNGLVVYGSSGGYSVANSVCDRVRTGSSGLGTCQCYLARSGNLAAPQTAVSFYGPTCSEPYNTSGTCVSSISGLYCGNSDSYCYLNGTNVPGFVPPDPTAPPSCHCLSQYTGEWCDYSLCSPSVYPASTACTPSPQSPTGQCKAYTSSCSNPINCQGSNQCSSGNCDWECQCYFVDSSNNNAVCDGSTGNSLINSPSCVYYSSTNPFTGVAGTQCKYPLQGCSYFDSSLGSNGEWTVCGYAGETSCQLQSYGSLGCTCPRAYSGQYCQNIVGCSGWCIGGSCPGTILDQETCNCDNFHTGLTQGSSCSASTPCCNTTTCGGGYPGTLVTINNNTQCDCPAGSSYKSPSTYQPVCYQPEQATFKGCSLDCPTTNGIECGGCNSVGAGNPSRCSSYTTLFGQGAAPTCDCSILAVDIASGSFAAVPWVTSSNGSCEPYCYAPGGTFNPYSLIVSPSNTWSPFQLNGPVCTCNAGHIGPRCNISFNPCQNGGIWDYTVSPPVCLCGTNGALNFPYSSASNCSQFMCDPVISVYNPAYSTSLCQCFPPYGLVGSNITCSSLCQNGGSPDTTTEQCQCPEPYYGAYCQITDCTNANPTASSCVCPQSYQYYDATSNRCLNESCNQGTRSPAGPCVCDNLWSGVTCATDLCAVIPSYGTAVPISSGSSTYACQCNPGYDLDANGMCTNSSCGVGGVTQACGGNTKVTCQLAGANYNCLCGDGAFALNSNGVATCFAPICGQHGSLVTQNNQYYCQCASGWYTDSIAFASSHTMCTSYQCNLTYSTFSYWDTTSSSCQCYYPYDNPPMCTDFLGNCGPGSTTPVFTVSNSVMMSTYMNSLTNPLLVFDLVNPMSTMMSCNCKPGYTLSTNALLDNSNGEPPCVVVCSTNGTALAGLTNCTCLPQWTGEFCEIPPVPPSQVVPGGSSSSSSSTSLPVYGIVLVVIGALVVVALLTFLIVRYACHKGASPPYRMTGTDEATND